MNIWGASSSVNSTIIKQGVKTRTQSSSISAKQLANVHSHLEDSKTIIGTSSVRQHVKLLKNFNSDKKS